MNKHIQGIKDLRGEIPTISRRKSSIFYDNPMFGNIPKMLAAQSAKTSDVVVRTGLWAKLKRTVSEMVSNTGMHGLPNVGNRRKNHRKILWALIVMTAFGTLVWQIYGLYEKYASYPVTTTSEVVTESELPFPAVTFCNLNPIRKSQTGDLPKDLKRVINILKSPSERRKKRASRTRRRRKRSKLVDLENFHWQYLSMDCDARVGVGHSLQTMLLDCEWDGIPCGPENFTTFSNWKYGNCYTFNHGYQEEIRKVRIPGSMRGLTMKINVQSYDYAPVLSTAIGMKLVVHDQAHMVFPEKDGVIVQPGAMTEVAISTMHMSRMTPPHGTCRNFDHHTSVHSDAYIVDFPHTKYSRDACMNTCVQKQIMRTCNCSSNRYPNQGVTYEDVPRNKHHHCSFDNELQRNCVNNEEKKIHDICHSTTVCPDTCMETFYTLTSSAARWPTQAEKEKVLNEIGRGDKSDSDDFIRSNILVVKVFLNDLKYLSYKTTEAMTLVDLMAGLGGTAGLWLGMSVVTVFELIEFLIDLLTVCWRDHDENKVESMA